MISFENIQNFTKDLLRFIRFTFSYQILSSGRRYFKLIYKIELIEWARISNQQQKKTEIKIAHKLCIKGLTYFLLFFPIPV